MYHHHCTAASTYVRLLHSGKRKYKLLIIVQEHRMALVDRVWPLTCFYYSSLAVPIQQHHMMLGSHMFYPLDIDHEITEQFLLLLTTENLTSLIPLKKIIWMHIKKHMDIPLAANPSTQALLQVRSSALLTTCRVKQLRGDRKQKRKKNMPIFH